MVKKDMKQLGQENAVESTLSKKYFAAVGRRKESISRVVIEPFSQVKAMNKVPFLINGKSLKDYFHLKEMQDIVLSPLKIIMKDPVKVSVKVSGGGIRGQAEATRLAIARALANKNPQNKKTLKDAGFLTVDSRRTERKKAGLKKARRAPQWQKR